MEDNKYLYMISLNRFRIFIIGSIIFCLFALFFFIGLAVGIHSADMDAIAIADEGPGERVPPAAVINLNTIDANRASTLQETEAVSSIDLLQRDTGGVPRETVPARDGDTEAKPQKYYVQIMATRDLKRARAVVQDLRDHRYRGYLNTRKDEGRTLYIVRVGLYTSRSKALHDLKILREKGGFRDAFLAANTPGGPRPNA